MPNATDKKQIFLTQWKRLAREFFDTIPEPVEEYQFTKARKFRFDFAIPEHMIGIEVDGGNAMVRYDKRGIPRAVGRHTKDGDYHKRNLATSLGWRVLAFTPKMLVDDPSACIYAVARTIQGVK